MSLPTEVVEIIIEDFISDHIEYSRWIKSDSDDFTPQFHLAPLLRVCRIWHDVAERYLYRSIAVGSRALVTPPRAISRREHRPMYGLLARRTRSYTPYYYEQDVYNFERHGYEFADRLLATLTTSPRLAAMVKTLRLGIELVNLQELPEWTHTNIRILHFCPNVEHVEIRGFEYTALDALAYVLKEKSLVSLCISSRNLQSNLPQRRVGRFAHVIDMVRKWPRLRRLRVEDFLDPERREDPRWFHAGQFARCCPELQEIIFTGDGPLYDFEFKTLRSICRRVVKFSASLYAKKPGRGGESARVVLCKCLRTWSYTLEYLKLDVLNFRGENPALTKAISGLRMLRELQVSGVKLGLAPISQLPYLERVACLAIYSWRELEYLLEDRSKYPSLAIIVLSLMNSHAFDERIKDICFRREIELREWNYCSPGATSKAGFLL